jgi:hypothetical protein
LNNGNSGDWELNSATAAVIGTWRPEAVVLVTDAVQGAGTRDVVANPFSDDEGTKVPIGDYEIGKYIISDADGTPVLLEITAVSGDDVTFAVASNPLAQSDSFVVQHYLPDSPDGQEKEAIAIYNGSVMVKISDIDWNFADGINMAAGYTAQNGSISSSDTVNSAIEKLDGNQQDLISLSGVAQGEIDLGAFTGSVIPDDQTIKQALQALETETEDKADRDLGNLTSPTAINQDLLPLSPNAFDLGASTNRWQDAYFGTANANAVETPQITSANALVIQTDNGNVEVYSESETLDLKSYNQVIAPSLRLYDADESASVGIKAPDILAGNYQLTLPADDGDPGYGLSTDGSGVLSWVEFALKSQVDEIDQNVDDLISLSGVAENSVNFGSFTGVSLADNQNAKQLFQRIEDLLEQMRGVQATGITTAATVDSVPHASVKSAKWLLEVFEEATPANRQAMEVFAATDGSAVDSTIYAKLKTGSNFNLTISVDISGADMRLRAASTTAGVTVTARRIEVVKSVL